MHIIGWYCTGDTSAPPANPIAWNVPLRSIAQVLAITSTEVKVPALVFPYALSAVLLRLSLRLCWTLDLEGVVAAPLLLFPSLQPALHLPRGLFRVPGGGQELRELQARPALERRRCDGHCDRRRGRRRRRRRAEPARRPLAPLAQPRGRGRGERRQARRAHAQLVEETRRPRCKPRTRKNRRRRYDTP